jgi:DNA-binding NarL/FixJ family response regulator
VVEEPRTRVVVVEDHAMLAEALAMALRLEGFDVTTVAATGALPHEDLLAAVAEVAPAVVLLDLHLGDGVDTIPVIPMLVVQGATVITLTGERDPFLLARCVEAGAAAVFDKAMSFTRLVQGVVDAANGHRVMSVAAREGLLSGLRAMVQLEEERLEPFRRLTGREEEVLRHLVDGRSADEIAASSSVAVSTVRSHIKSLLRKLGVGSQLAAVAMARAADWPPDA